MIRVEVQIKGLEEAIAKMEGADKVMAEARLRGLYSALGYIRGRIYDWIQSEGEGTWPGFHPLTMRYQKKGGGLWGRRSRFLGRANWNWLMQFVNSWQARSGYSGGIRYGREREGWRVSQRVLDLERGRTFPVTPAVRRLMGATRREKDDVPGVTFFPLRKTTAQLRLPRRPVIAPVYQKEQFRAIEEFERSFDKKIEKEL